MTSFFKSLLRSSEERISNPLIGSFCISFIIFNWKAFTFFFLSKQSIENKLNYIVENYSDTKDLLTLPLLVTFFYVLILPTFSFFIDKVNFWAYSRKVKSDSKKKILVLDGSIEVANKKAELEQAISDYKGRLDLNKEISELKTKNDSLSKSYHELVDKNKKLQLDLVNVRLSEAKLDRKIQIISKLNNNFLYRVSLDEIISCIDFLEKEGYTQKFKLFSKGDLDKSLLSDNSFANALLGFKLIDNFYANDTSNTSLTNLGIQIRDYLS